MKKCKISNRSTETTDIIKEQRKFRTNTIPNILEWFFCPYQDYWWYTNKTCMIKNWNLSNSCPQPLLPAAVPPAIDLYLTNPVTDDSANISKEVSSDDKGQEPLIPRYFNVSSSLLNTHTVMCRMEKRARNYSKRNSNSKRKLVCNKMLKRKMGQPITKLLRYESLRI